MIRINKRQAAEGFWLGYCSNHIDRTFLDEMKKRFAWNMFFSWREALQDLESMILETFCNSTTPISILVSGGVDSTFLLLLLRKYYSAENLKPVIVSFDEREYDESERAIDLCQRVGLKPTIVKVGPYQARQTLAKVEEGIYRSWFFSSSLIPTYAGIKRAADIGSTIITGDGADELFCGYDRTLMTSWTDKFPQWSKNMLLHFMKTPKTERSRKFLEMLYSGYVGTVRLWQREEVEELIGVNPRNTTFDGFYREIVGMRNVSQMERYMLLDIATELYGLEVEKVETAVRMAGNPLVISPFLDRSVMLFCASLPLEFKYHMGVRKWLLRKSISERLPGFSMSHKKRGFAVPIGRWFDSIELRGRFRHLVLSETKIDPWLNQKKIQRVWDDHVAGFDQSQKLWSVLIWRLLLENGILKLEDLI